LSRVVFWNIQQFALPKIDDPDFTVTGKRRRRVAGGQTPNQASTARANLIAAVFAAAVPDIIVVIEVSSGADGQDRATNSGGMQGAISMLNTLRAGDAASEWRMVPPLRIGTGGPEETMAVLYKGITAAGTPAQVNRFFTGPNLWVGAQNGVSTVPAFGVVGNAYPGVVAAGDPDLNAMLVYPGNPVRNIPAGALHNGGGAIPEDTVAARIRFQQTAALGGGVMNAYGNYRQPYMVTFTEQDVAGNLEDLTIFGVHTPPNATAVNFITWMTNTAEVVDPLGANETRVIGGDFNPELTNLAGRPSGVYAPLNGATFHYMPLLQSPGAAGALAPAPPAPPPLPPSSFDVWQGYFATHILRSKTNVVSEFLWSSPNKLSAYPGYRYYGSEFGPNLTSIDNILVWPIQPAPGHNYLTTIMNLVVGTPFTAANAYVPGGGTAAAPPTGSIVLPSGMAPAAAGYAAWPVSPTAPLTNQGTRRHLTSWAQYGKIRSTSDHFAVFANL